MRTRVHDSLVLDRTDSLDDQLAAVPVINSEALREAYTDDHRTGRWPSAVCEAPSCPRTFSLRMRRHSWLMSTGRPLPLVQAVQHVSVVRSDLNLEDVRTSVVMRVFLQQGIRSTHEILLASHVGAPARQQQ